MYIEFKLPRGAGGSAAAYYLSKLRAMVVTWSENYNPGSYYLQPTKNYTVELHFARDEDVTLFTMTWDTEAFIAARFTVVDN